MIEPDLSSMVARVSVNHLQLPVYDIHMGCRAGFSSLRGMIMGLLSLVSMTLFRQMEVNL